MLAQKTGEATPKKAKALCPQTRNQREVAKRLLAGHVAMVGGTGWSSVEPFLVGRTHLNWSCEVDQTRP